MTWANDLSSLLASPFGLLVLGFIGGFLACLANWKDIDGFGDAAFILISGTLFAFFFAEGLISMIGFTGNMANGVTTLIGAFSGAILRLGWRTLKTADLWDAIKTKFFT